MDPLGVFRLTEQGGRVAFRQGVGRVAGGVMMNEFTRAGHIHPSGNGGGMEQTVSQRGIGFIQADEAAGIFVIVSLKAAVKP